MNPKSCLLLSSLLSIVLHSPLSSLAASNDSLAESGSTQLPIEAKGPESLAVWSGGALLIVQYRFSDSPVFSSFDREGKLISQFTFTIPEARVNTVFDRSFARGFDGSVAIVGSAYTADSRGTSYLAWVSPDGMNQNIVRLSPFHAWAVTVAADGAIWVAGDEKKVGQEPDLSQSVIRRYDKTGKLLGSYIPWSNLHVDAQRSPAEESILVSSKERVGWYSRFQNVSARHDQV